MKKKYLIATIILMTVFVAVLLAGCADTDNYKTKGEVEVELVFDKDYPDILVECPQAVQIKNNGLVYNVLLRDKAPVAIIVSAKGFERQYINITSLTLKDGKFSKAISLNKKEYTAKVLLAFENSNNSVALNDVAVSVEGLEEGEYKKTIVDNRISIVFQEKKDYNLTFSAEGFMPNSFKLSESNYLYEMQELEVPLIKKSSTVKAFALTNDSIIGVKEYYSEEYVNIEDIYGDTIASMSPEFGKTKTMFVKVNDFYVTHKNGKLTYYNADDYKDSPYLNITLSALSGRINEGTTPVIVNVDNAQIGTKKDRAAVYDGAGVFMANIGIPRSSNESDFSKNKQTIKVKLGDKLLFAYESDSTYAMTYFYHTVTAEDISKKTVNLNSADAESYKRSSYRLKFVDLKGNAYTDGLEFSVDGSPIAPDENGIVQFSDKGTNKIVGIMSINAVSIKSIQSQFTHQSIYEYRAPMGKNQTFDFYGEVHHHTGDYVVVTLSKEMVVKYKYIDKETKTEVKLVNYSNNVVLPGADGYYESTMYEGWDNHFGSYSLPAMDADGAINVGGAIEYFEKRLKYGINSNICDFVGGEYFITIELTREISVAFQIDVGPIFSRLGVTSLQGISYTAKNENSAVKSITIGYGNGSDSLRTINLKMRNTFVGEVLIPVEITIYGDRENVNHLVVIRVNITKESYASKTVGTAEEVMPLN